uniref:Putative NodN (Nodulation factor N) (Modular protein) n=1 Tax=mine drainage metagenome TaxID=410659 RepID=E6Q631_9ZZZZ
MAAKIVLGFSGLRALEGSELVSAPWLRIDQRRIDAFAACTDDRQWIHVDPVRAATSLYGGTIAHGYLVLSLVPALWHRACSIREMGSVLNYGLDRVRFLAPVRSGARVRARFSIASVRAAASGLRVAMHVAIEAFGSEEPVCVADAIFLYRAPALTNSQGASPTGAGRRSAGALRRARRSATGR